MDSPDALYRAVASRDRRFEGRFIVAVTTTGIYCRPGCPARVPRRENVRFYRHPAAAEQAGFRACARCRPDAAFFDGTSASVRRALALIDGGALDGGDVGALAERLGMGDRHLRRLFRQHLGASPQAVATTRRAHFARHLLERSAMPLAEVAFAAGFGSVRRFNSDVKRAFGATPRELRGRRPAPGGGALTLWLPVKPPYAWDELLSFLAARAIPGVEHVEDGVYRRSAGGGVVEVRPGPRRLELTFPASSAAAARDTATRARRLFDTGADPAAIGKTLARDPALAAAVKARPGLRVPGAWDGFEIAVRAVLGQQVSVARASALAGKLVAAWGAPLAAPAGPVTHAFPSPRAIAEAGGDELARVLGMPRARGRALAAIAAAVEEGTISLDAPDRERLVALPGVGPWTAEYLALRLGEPDAFPAGDLGLRRALSLTERELAARAEAWRPFRGYAALHLWSLP
jgi:AraC family transcriptional regulator of adaptative response / DNA-3-methyladenine glycosylase II